MSVLCALISQQVVHFTYIFNWIPGVGYQS
jgi:hypothetical protein